MIERFICFLLIVGLCGACSVDEASTVSVDSVVPVENSEASPTPTPNKIRVGKLTDSELSIVYFSSIEVVYYGRDETPIFGPWNPNRVVHRIQMIRPPSAVHLVASGKISPALAADFEDSNKRPGKLDAEYGVKMPSDSIDSTLPLPAMYRKALPGRVPLGAVVAFSNAGFDQSNLSCLVYGEFYSPKTGIVKFWLVYELEVYKFGTDQHRFSNAHLKAVLTADTAR